MLVQDIAGSSHVGLSVYVAEPAIAGAWLARQCEQLREAQRAILILRANSDSAYRVVAKWPDYSFNESALAQLAEQALSSAATQTTPLESSTSLQLALPIVDTDTFLGAVAIELRDCQDGGLRALALLNLGIGWLVSAASLDRLAEATNETARLREAATVLDCSTRWESPTVAAMEICNLVSQRYECILTAIGIARPRGCKLLAISHSAWFDHRSQLVRTIENAMDEALDQRRGVCLPSLPGAKLGLSVAHRDFATGRVVLSVLLAGMGNLGAGVLLLQRETERPFNAGEVDALTRIAQTVGPVLEQKYDGYRWVGLRARLLWRGVRERLKDPRRPALRVGLALGLSAVAGLSLLDATWRVAADAVIEGQQQRAISAPFDGFIHVTHAKAGETVKENQPLAELDRRSLQLDYQRWAAEEIQHDRRFHDALVNHDRAAAGVARAQREEAAAQRALAKDKLSRAVLRSPFDAVIVSGDLHQQLGSPVDQGKVLFELAPLDSYRVFLKVDERDIRAIHVGQTGRLVLSGLASDSLPFTVKNISVPEAHDGRNVFRVEAELQASTSKLRPGMNGVGKIDVGERSLLWIWTHRAWDWVVITLWRWLP